MNRTQTSQMTSGVLMIALGLIFLAGQLNIAPGLDLSRLWPVFPILLGLSKIVAPTADDDRHRRHGRFGGLWLILVGVIFLLSNFHVMTLRQSWPLFVVAAGVGILFGGGRRADVPEPTEEKR